MDKHFSGKIDELDADRVFFSVNTHNRWGHKPNEEYVYNIVNQLKEYIKSIKYEDVPFQILSFGDGMSTEPRKIYSGNTLKDLVNTDTAGRAVEFHRKIWAYSLKPHDGNDKIQKPVIIQEYLNYVVLPNYNNTMWVVQDEIGYRREYYVNEKQQNTKKLRFAYIPDCFKPGYFPIPTKLTNGAWESRAAFYVAGEDQVSNSILDKNNTSQSSGFYMVGFN